MQSLGLKQVRAHYEALLSEHYTWTFGGSAAKFKINYALLKELLEGTPGPHLHASLESAGYTGTPAVQPRGGGGGGATQEPKEPTTINNNLPTHSDHDVVHGRVAVDLGCGSGFQTLPLLQLGYRVKAVDASEALLAELAHEAAAVCPDAVSRLQSVCGDILDSSNFIYEQEQEDSRCSSLPPPAVTASSPELIVCMGDTLTHLASIAEVNALLADAYAALVPGGRLIVQFRDLTQPLHGTDRFIPVRSDERTVFTCFLEWENNNSSSNNSNSIGTTVTTDTTTGTTTTITTEPTDGSGCIIRVHDLVHVKKGIGAWELCKSWYKKLGLTSNYVSMLMQSHGFHVVLADNDGGMVLLMAVHP
ncbi:hypothetical protein BASA62_000431 [Batrachochytrium salamandrivorans]|nr:hypothetical protein BASA62_000431 [Batrachochytrium salamandrivorans]